MIFRRMKRWLFLAILCVLPAAALAAPTFVEHDDPYSAYLVSRLDRPVTSACGATVSVQADLLVQRASGARSYGLEVMAMGLRVPDRLGELDMLGGKRLAMAGQHDEHIIGCYASGCRVTSTAIFILTDAEMTGATRDGVEGRIRTAEGCDVPVEVPASDWRALSDHSPPV